MKGNDRFELTKNFLRLYLNTKRIFPFLFVSLADMILGVNTALCTCSLVQAKHWGFLFPLCLFAFTVIFFDRMSEIDKNYKEFSTRSFGHEKHLFSLFVAITSFRSLIIASIWAMSQNLSNSFLVLLAGVLAMWKMDPKFFLIKSHTSERVPILLVLFWVRALASVAEWLILGGSLSINLARSILQVPSFACFFFIAQLLSRKLVNESQPKHIIYAIIALASAHFLLFI